MDMDASGDLDPHQLHAALSEVMASQEDSGRTNNSSTSPSRPGSSGRDKPNKKRVGWTYDGTPHSTSGLTTPGESPSPFLGGGDNPFFSRLDPESTHAGPSTTNSRPVSRVISHAELSAEIHRALGQPFPSKPKPAIRKTTAAIPTVLLPHEDEDDERKRSSKIRAHESAQQLAKSVQSWSAPGSRRNSAEIEDVEAGFATQPERRRKFSGFIPLHDLRGPPTADSDDDDFAGSNWRPRQRPSDQADHIVNQYIDGGDFSYRGVQSVVATPTEERTSFLETGYVPKPQTYRGGVLGALLKLGQTQPLDSTGSGLGGYVSRQVSADSPLSGASTAANSPNYSPSSSGTSTPVRKHRYHHRNQSTVSISELIKASSNLAAPGGDLGPDLAMNLKKTRPLLKKKDSSNTIQALHKILKGTKLNAEKYRIKQHIEGIVLRRRYLTLLCKALMRYGAPTHRLEEYMMMSARVLEIEGSFLYIPGCMIISFDDSSIGTSEVKLVRTPQGVDLGRLRDTHEIYKDVVHDRIGVSKAADHLDKIMKAKPKFHAWALVPVYGLASLMVGPFAFEARWIDLPMCFLLGTIVGVLQLIVAPRSDLFINVFEVAATVITSFLARALGSLRGGELFCFSALAQSSVALILPGYIVLCASLELQSKNIVSGSVRMVYAIIYSFFLGFGITIGSALYGILDSNATSATNCTNPLSDGKYYEFFPFVIGFTICLIIINQAKWKQLPWMVIVAFCGYIVNYFSSKRFSGNVQISNTLGALTIGVLANLEARISQKAINHSFDFWETYCQTYWHKYIRRPCNRIRNRTNKAFNRVPSQSTPVRPLDEKPTLTRKIGYGLAAASMLPAIFVQVPSGIAVSGSLVSGIVSANQITGNVTGSTTVSTATETGNINSVAFNVGYSVIQVAIGITVGLFLSALVVYPLGKKRSGLFSF